MSVPVELEALAEHMASFGPLAFLVSAGVGGSPHVVSVAPEWHDDVLVMSAGARTRGNVEAVGQATLLWAAAPGGDYCLIVDGEAEARSDGVAVRPSRAVLHRLVSADAAKPSCVTVL